MRRLASALVLAVAVAALACSSTYHPEYHPETSYSYVQNVTYAKNVWQDASGRAAPGIEGDATGEPGLVPHARGRVSSPGAVVVYGNFYGNIYVGR